jgi:hypothetical protein
MPSLAAAIRLCVRHFDRPDKVVVGMAMNLTAGRTDGGAAGSARGNDPATEVASRCLPKPEGPEEHSSIDPLRESNQIWHGKPYSKFTPEDWQAYKIWSNEVAARGDAW